MTDRQRAVFLTVLILVSMVGMSTTITGSAVAEPESDETPTTADSISEMYVTNTVDDDGDSYYSDFDLLVFADGDLDTPITRTTDPYLAVIIDGEEIKSKDIRTEYDGYSISLEESTLESHLDRGWISIEVELRNSQIGSDEVYDTTSESLRYEPPSEDITTRDRGLVGIESLDGSYAQSGDYLDRDYWASAQIGSVEDSFEALFPTVPEDRSEAQKEAAIELLDEYATEGLVDDLTTAPTVIDSVGDSLEQGKIANTLGKSSSATRSNFHNNHDDLERNTDDIISSSDPSDEQLETRLDLIEDAYEQSIEYEAEVGNSLTDNQEFFPDLIIWLYGADEDSYNTVQGYFKQYRESLRADYYYTQLARYPGQTPDALDDRANDDQPSYPTAEITSFSVPDEVTVGEPVTVSMTATTEEKDTPSQTMTLSFPDDDAIDDLTISNSELSDTQHYRDDRLWTGYGEEQQTISYSVVEGVESMDEGETNTLETTFVPTESGEIRIQAKSIAWASNEQGTMNPDPGWADESSSDVVRDGQDELSYERTISVKERSPPEADAGSSYSVSEGESVELDASDSSASDSEIVDTDWSLIDGPGDLSGDTYTAPIPIDSDSSATVELEVTDDYGETDTDTATISITSDADPDADAGGPYTVEMDGSVALDSSDSSAPDTTIEDTEWVLEDGPGSVDGDTYYAPESISSDTTATVELTVTDSNDATTTDTATITIEAPDPPEADAGGPYSVKADGTVDLDASDSTAPDDEIVDTEWEVTDGLGSVKGDTYNAPSSVDDDDSATVELTVTDSNDATATDTATITITTLEPPKADAGGLYSVEAAETVNLNASDSTAPDGEIVDTEWDVTDGPGSISDGKYTAPDTISDEGSASVEVTITDSNDATDTDTATIDLISDEPSHQFILTNVTPSHSGVVEPETTLEIETTIENQGQDSDTQPVELFFNGESVDQQTVEVEAGDDEQITLSTSVPKDAGEYEWYVRTHDDQSETRTITVDSGDHYGHVVGSVLTLNNEPVSGTTVELVDEGTDDPTETTTTGPDGTYTFENVSADRSYYVETTANGETTTAHIDALEDGKTVTADLVLPIELDNDFSVSVTNEEVTPNGSTLITVQSESAAHLEVSGDTESWTIKSMDPLAGVIGNPTMENELPYESGDEEWFYADSDLDELTIELLATVESGVYEFTAYEFDADTELVDKKTVEIEVTDGDYDDWPVDENTAAAIDQDGDGDLALDDLRNGVAEWQSDGEIDGSDLSLGDLRELVDWWAE